MCCVVQGVPNDPTCQELSRAVASESPKVKLPFAGAGKLDFLSPVLQAGYVYTFIDTLRAYLICNRKNI
jgi:hypothetical protein